MNTQITPLLSSSRREFIVGAAGIAIAGLAATSLLALLPKLSQDNVTLSLQTAKRLHLDLPEAKRIANQFVVKGNEGDGDWLELADYASASLDALDHLASLGAGFVTLGLEWLSPAMASQLARWKSHFLIFDSIDRLTPNVTRILNTSNHALVFSNLKHLDIEAAKYLVDDGYHPLDIHLPGVLSLPLAKTLSMHPHELSLSIYSLEPRAAKVLARHQGYYLNIASKQPFSENTLQAFSGNAMKYLTTNSGEYGCSLNWKATKDWWDSFHQSYAFAPVNSAPRMG